MFAGMELIADYLCEKMRLKSSTWILLLRIWWMRKEWKGENRWKIKSFESPRIPDPTRVSAHDFEWIEWWMNGINSNNNHVSDRFAGSWYRYTFAGGLPAVCLWIVFMNLIFSSTSRVSCFSIFTDFGNIELQAMCCVERSWRRSVDSISFSCSVIIKLFFR